VGYAHPYSNGLCGKKGFTQQRPALLQNYDNREEETAVLKEGVYKVNKSHLATFFSLAE